MRHPSELPKDHADYRPMGQDRPHDDGGPAFPRDLSHDYAGMSLRDYFAAKALSGLLAGVPEEGSGYSHDQYAEDAYAFADAMLKERQS